MTEASGTVAGARDWCPLIHHEPPLFIPGVVARLIDRAHGFDVEIIDNGSPSWVAATSSPSTHTRGRDYAVGALSEKSRSSDSEMQHTLPRCMNCRRIPLQGPQSGRQVVRQ
jgi:hypothetical protein